MKSINERAEVFAEENAGRDSFEKQYIKQCFIAGAKDEREIWKEERRKLVACVLDAVEVEYSNYIHVAVGNWLNKHSELIAQIGKES